MNHQIEDLIVRWEAQLDLWRKGLGHMEMDTERLLRAKVDLAEKWLDELKVAAHGQPGDVVRGRGGK